MTNISPHPSTESFHVRVGQLGALERYRLGEPETQQVRLEYDVEKTLGFLEKQIYRGRAYGDDSTLAVRFRELLIARLALLTDVSETRTTGEDE